MTTPRIQLIPVLEISNYGQGIPLPQNGPFWEHAEDWEQFRQLGNQAAGFPDELNACLYGSSIYEITAITDENLIHLIKMKLSEEEVLSGEELLFLPGGYVLNVDGQDVLFPQCCCDLGTIESWEALINDDPEHFYAGHPSPVVIREGEILQFDFTRTDSGERFSPPVPVERMEFTVEELNGALAAVKEKLSVVAERLLMINEREKLNIPDIAKRILFNQTL